MHATAGAGLLSLGLLSLLGPIPPAWADTAPPRRVVSINLCADEFLLALAEPKSIASLSFVAADPSVSLVPDRARLYPLNRGSAEEIAALRPDLVVSMAGRADRTRFVLDRLGIPDYEMAIPENMAALESLIVQLARRLGQLGRGAALTARLHRAEAALRAEAAGAHGSVLFYGPNGYTFGPETLPGEGLIMAGWTDAAQGFGIASYGEVALEQVVARPPNRLLVIDASGASYAQRLLEHPALRRIPSMLRTAFPQSLLLCPGPWTLEALGDRLRGGSSPVPPP